MRDFHFVVKSSAATDVFGLTAGAPGGDADAVPFYLKLRGVDGDSSDNVLMDEFDLAARTTRSTTAPATLPEYALLLGT